MRQLFFEDNIDDDKYCGVLYGLGISWTPQSYSSMIPGTSSLNISRASLNNSTNLINDSSNSLTLTASDDNSDNDNSSNENEDKDNIKITSTNSDSALGTS